MHKLLRFTHKFKTGWLRSPSCCANVFIRYMEIAGAKNVGFLLFPAACLLCAKGTTCLIRTAEI